eukprot:m.134184 g.134184  ORF g.134184 m.134184 type:complete len:71 (+) comp9521_c0_seq1:344-556(+)
MLGGLCLLVENGLCLSTESTLFSVITALSLGEEGGLTSLVLCDLVHRVFSTLLGLAESSPGLWNIHHLVS